MTDQLKKRKKTRTGTEYVGKILPEAKQIVTDFQPEQRARAVQLRTALNEQLTLLEPLDKDIVQFMEDNDEVDEAAMGDEIEKCFKLRSEMKAAIDMIDELLPQTVTAVTSEAGDLDSIVEEDEEVQSSASGPTYSQSPIQGHSVRAKLPKLEVKKFNGKIEEWQEFWDGFESAIHQNPENPINRTSKSAIAGFSLTTANKYESAVQLLKKRYGKVVKIH